MAYSDLDELAINTIRTLAVRPSSPCLPSMIPEQSVHDPGAPAAGSSPSGFTLLQDLRPPLSTNY